MRWLHTLLIGIFCGTWLLASAPALAQTGVQPGQLPDTPVLEPVLVTGEQPGPGLWKVSRDDHVLWILGTLSPLPKKMQWRSQKVESTIAQSQEVLSEPSVSVEIGFFRGLTLLPALLHARKNPDGRTLKDVLTPELYGRWVALKAKYYGRGNAIESRRPMIAAHELYDAAIAKVGLTARNDVWEFVSKQAKKNNVPIVALEIKVDVDDPKAMIRDFENTSVDADVECLATTIKRIETDMQGMRLRANAWATGDLEALRRLPYPDQYASCLAAISSAPKLRERIQAIRAQREDDWVKAARTALTKNRSTFAVVPMAELVKPDGRLDRLRALGYTIEEPE